MRTIIIAAGLGSRLLPLTNDTPKCLLDVGGKNILQRQREAFRLAGIRDIALVKGYKQEKIRLPSLRYYINDDYRNNNILCSLMYAEAEMNEEFIATYSDIIFTDDVVKQLMRESSPIAIVVDVEWKDYYEGRTDHGLEQAENVVISEDQNVFKIGKHINEADCAAGHQLGEFIGMFKCTKEGAKIFREYFHRAKKEFFGKPFMRASVFNKAYVSDFIQYLVDNNIKIKCVVIRKGWYEIDTIQDLERVKNLLKTHHA